MIDFAKYKTIVFDCDGVVLNSNTIKTQAFYNTALPYGEKMAKALVDYHLHHGGVSRYKKFEYFLINILKFPHSREKLDKLLRLFAHEVKKSLMICEIASGLKNLRDKTKHTRWLIVSGGDQEELRDVFGKRKLSPFFDGGIFGSPDTKDQILNREMRSGNIENPALYFGDSRYDFEAAKVAGIDFIFVREWSEWRDWRNYCSNQEFKAIKTISSI